MKRRMQIPMVLLLALVMAFAAAACGGGGTAGGTPGETPGGETPEDPHDPSLNDFTGITFPAVTVTYDGAEHEALISGDLPEGTQVVYTDNKGTDAGTYNAQAKLSLEGYNDKTLRTTLTINKAQITGITMTGDTLDYDGSPHSLQIAGTLPAGVTASYTYNDQSATSVTDAGTYNVEATLSGKNYETKKVSATLTINKIEITAQLTFASSSVEYDGLDHSIRVTGNIPAGVTISYTYNGTAAEGVSDEGEYTVVATLSGTNYITKTLTATLTITASTLPPLYSARLGSKVYFQNPLDNDRLYVYESGAIKMAVNDAPSYLTVGGNSLYYFSNSLLRSAIRKIGSDGKMSAVYSASGEYLVSDGTNLYYAVNNTLLNTDKNGIYSIPVSGGDEVTPTRLYTGSASWLCPDGTNLYFAAGASKGNLMRVSTSGGAAAQVSGVTGEVSQLIADNGTLYFNLHSTAAAAIYRVSASGGTPVKMTTDKGKNLTIVGNYLYYVNSDVLTTAVFGKGINRVSKTASGSQTGEKVVDDRANSLTSDGTYLYYYTQSNKHFVRCGLDGSGTTDLMANFVPQAPPAIDSFAYTHIAEYEGEIWYTDPRDGDAIYKYNPDTKANVKVISDSCSEFLIEGEYIYYTTFVLSNYALWRMPINGGDAQKLSSDRADRLTIKGDYLYYVDNGATSNTLVRIKKDGTGTKEKMLGDCDDKPYIMSLDITDDAYYYCHNPALGSKAFHRFDIATQKSTKVCNGDMFVVKDGKYYIHDQSSHKLMVYDSVTKGEATEVLTDIKIDDMTISGNDIYLSATVNKVHGVYRYTIGGAATATKVADGDAMGLTATSKGIAFIRVSVSWGILGVGETPTASATSTGKLCILGSDGTLTEI